MTNRQFSRFTIQGRVVRIDVKDRITRLTVCANYSYTDTRDGETKQDPHYVSTIAFNQKPREAMAGFGQGDLVKLEGRLKDTRFTDREGNVRYATDKVVWDAELVAAKKVPQAA